MIGLPSAAPPALARTMRLVSGLILGLFLVMHFLNIGLGLVSVGAMDLGRPFLTDLWSNDIGNIVLFAAMAIHFGLTLRTLYRRQTLVMSGREVLQYAFGLLFPFLLVPHVIRTEIVPVWTGRPMDFAHEVYSLWVRAPALGAKQVVALALGWTHGCIGFWYWSRTKRWYPRAASALLMAAVLIPLSALVGFFEAGKEVARLPATAFPTADLFRDRADAVEYGLYAGLAALICGVLVARVARDWIGLRSRVRIEYPDRQVVIVPAGFTILEASRFGRVPHTAVCGGRGRCSTCRVRILKNLREQPRADAEEQATLDRIKAEPDVRLACQLRPTHDLTVFPVFTMPRPNAKFATTPLMAVPATGIEREMAVLFCDLRSFTRRAERLLPYDTVFILNRYFETVGRAVESSGGYLDKFIGDGALALFGLETEPEVACRQALRAAAAIAQGLDDLNAHLEAELNGPLRIAMGLHLGPAVVGEMGFGRATSLTAIGDGINVASRLESTAKELNVEAVISAALIERAAVSLPDERRAIAVRGRSTPVEAVVVRHARSLEAFVSVPDPVPPLQQPHPAAFDVMGHRP